MYVNVFHYKSFAHHSTRNPTSEAFSCVWAVSSWSHSRRMDLGSTLPPPQLQPSRRGVYASFRFKSDFKFAPSRPAIKIQTTMLPDKVERVGEKNNIFGDGHGWIYIWDYGKCQTYWMDSNYLLWLWCACKHSDIVHVAHARQWACDTWRHVSSMAYHLEAFAI